MSYLMPLFDSLVKVWFGLFTRISTPNGLFNANIVVPLQRFDLVYLLEYKLLMGYLMLTFDSFVKVWFGLFNSISTPYGLFHAIIWFLCKGLVWFGLFNSISTPNGLSNANIWFLCKGLVWFIYSTAYQLLMGYLI